MADPDRLRAAYRTARDALLAERTPGGFWVGELSASALSTATAVTALDLVRRRDPAAPPHSVLVARGLCWLAAHQNADGGWGDTTRSVSNISTTLLCVAAFHATDSTADYAGPLEKARGWLRRYGETPAELAEAVRARYGKDRTFAVPILTTMALAKLADWSEVPALPFEAAVLPQSWYRFARLPVVSYALPALIAIGQCVHHHRPSRNPLLRAARAAARGPSLRVLERVQPPNGGFLEATPLTSFVTMSLAAVGHAGHPVARKGVEFLAASVREDGSWPIDTNLSTWVTTLAVNALASADDVDVLDRREELIAWLLAQQYSDRHPFTGAEPGGWAWTPLPGGVPDCDDTPGALLALVHLGHRVGIGRPQGYRWVLGLQNRDGGWPTFCRGWGRLPFDRSGSDLTAHALRAFDTWSSAEGERAIGRGLAYLAREQRPDGSWLPLWFGNQHAPDDINPVYGTARVLAAYRDLDRGRDEPARRGVSFLLGCQNADGGWGGAAGTPSSVEETALAVEALVDLAPDGERAAVERGLDWLVAAVESGRFREPSPIGFYFAKLWYFEKLYPVIFTAATLGRACRLAPHEPRP